MDALPIDPGLGALLERNREALVRRWLMLSVERSDFGELSSRPLGERVRELDLLWEAARDGEAAEQPPAVTAPEPPPAGVTPLFRN
ncbi:MAG: hypothetical protein H0V29_03555 [Thermoleophilaceae bacterium]|nr:hypothetical protein [Thermoleophilaceae bacterium]